MSSIVLCFNSIKQYINKCNKALNKIQEKPMFDYFVFFIIFILALLIKLNITYLDIFSIIIFALLSLVLRIEKVFYVFIFLFFIDPVMKIDIIGGAITRVLVGIGLLRIGILYIKNNKKLKKDYLYICIFLFAFLAYTILFGEHFEKSIFLFVYMIFFILMCNYLSFTSKNFKKNVYNGVFNSILYGVVFSILYGLFVGNYMLEARNGFVVKRFNGTIDPNFMAFYINMALTILLFNYNFKTKNNKRKILICALYIILIIALVLTKSVTGMLINFVSFFIFFIVKRKKKIIKTIKTHKVSFATAIAIFIISISFSMFLIVKNNINKTHYNANGELVADNRIADIIMSIRKLDIDRLTSRKTEDWRIYWNDITNGSVLNIMFGHGIYPSTLYSSHFGKNVESHNAYLDLLRCYGIIGCIIIMIFIVYKIKNDLFLCEVYSNKMIKYLRIIILIYAVELSIYTSRISWIIFIV